MPRKRNKLIQFDYDWITSKDDTTAIPVCLTWRERQMLLTVVDTIGWPTRWAGDPDEDLIDQWRTELFMKLTGECAVDCADVWTCLGITPGDFAALLDWLIAMLQGSDDVRQVLTDGGEGDTEHPLTDVVMIDDCDKDTLFAFCLQLVQFINRSIEDLYQLLELKTNLLEYVEIITRHVPIIGKVLSYVEELLDSYVDAYIANYDQALEEEYACDLFCLALENDCTLTWHQLTSYFLERAETDLDDKDFDDLLLYYATGIWSGDEPCHVAFGTFCAALHFGGKYFDFDLTGVQRIWESILNDSNSDWAILCDCGWFYKEKFPSTYGYWSLFTKPAGWSPSFMGALGTPDGLIDTTAEYVPDGNYREGAHVETVVFDARYITRVQFRYEALVVGTPTPNTFIRLWNGAVMVDEEILQLETTGGEAQYYKALYGDAGIQATKVEVYAVDGLGGSPPAGSLHIEYITIAGLGNKPTQLGG